MNFSFAKNVTPMNEVHISPMPHGENPAGAIALNTGLSRAASSLSNPGGCGAMPEGVSSSKISSRILSHRQFLKITISEKVQFFARKIFSLTMERRGQK